MISDSARRGSERTFSPLQSLVPKLDLLVDDLSWWTNALAAAACEGCSVTGDLDALGSSVERFAQARRAV